VTEAVPQTASADARVENSHVEAKQADKPKRAKPKPTIAQFEQFWDGYPLRKGKPRALERFVALTPDHLRRHVLRRGKSRHMRVTKRRLPSLLR
jgi:hypothetical protein